MRAFFAFRCCKAAIDAEISVLRGEVCVSVCWDLTSFFDTVQPSVIIPAARAMQFPLRLLALSLQVHLAPRLLSDRGIVHPQPVHVGSSIMAGFIDSIPITCAFIHPPVHRIHSSFPGTTCDVYVDDIAQQECSRSQIGGRSVSAIPGVGGAGGHILCEVWYCCYLC